MLANPHVNDNRSPLLNLIACVDCQHGMKIERIDPDGQGNDLIRYRCKICQRVELVKLTRRDRG
jgi:hypothetical protein